MAANRERQSRRRLCPQMGFGVRYSRAFSRRDKRTVYRRQMAEWLTTVWRSYVARFCSVKGKARPETSNQAVAGGRWQSSAADKRSEAPVCAACGAHDSLRFARKD